MRISSCLFGLLVAIFILSFSSFKIAPGPSLLRVSKSGRFLVKENGDPFFWLGDTAWNLFIRLNREEAEKYLKDRKSKKFSVIQAHLLGWEVADKNAYGFAPFNNNDFKSPNDEYWKQVDFIVTTAEQLGLYMGLLPAWASTYTEKRKNSKNDSISFPLEKDTIAAYQYGRYLGTRYKNNKNIIWILGGDVWGRKDEIYDNLAKGLTETYADGNPFKILISFHPQGGTNRPPATSTSEFYHNKSWLDFNMIQSGHRVGNKNYERIAKDYDTLPVKPTLESEPCYEEHPIQHAFKNGVFNAWHLRQRAYWSILAGSLGFTYGANGIWQMDKPDKIDKQTHFNNYWYQALDYEGGKQMAFVRALMESRPMNISERIPDQGLLLSADTGVENHIQCARAKNYSYLFAYSTSGADFIIDLPRMKAKKLNAWWYNPRDGKLYNNDNRLTLKPFKVFQARRKETFNPPGNAGPGNDWILVVDDASQSFNYPGYALL
ncbi:MAG: glycoside hydrolase family 140 protein [Chitinophagaceae bacterium]